MPDTESDPRADTVRVPELWEIPVDEVQPFDMLEEGRLIYRLDFGIFDFGTWPNVSRGPGVQLHVATTWAEVEVVEMADGTKHELKRPVHEDAEVILCRSGQVVRVLRGVPIPTRRPEQSDGDDRV